MVGAGYGMWAARGFRNPRPAGGRRMPWIWIVLLSLSFGASIGLMLQNIGWGAAVIVVVLVGLLVTALAAPRDVRPAIKQDVWPGPTMSVKQLIPILAIYPVVMLLPRENMVVSVAAGVVSAGLVFYLMAKGGR